MGPRFGGFVGGIAGIGAAPVLGIGGLDNPAPVPMTGMAGPVGNILPGSIAGGNVAGGFVVTSTGLLCLAAN